jgi:hypothetical protein
MSNSKHYLRVFFYPWATLDPVSLKRALLYFDEVAICSPIPLGESIDGSSASIDSIEALVTLSYLTKNQSDRFRLLRRLQEIHEFHVSISTLVNAGVVRVVPGSNLPAGISGDKVDKMIQRFISEGSPLKDPTAVGITIDELLQNESTSMLLGTIKAISDRFTLDKEQFGRQVGWALLTQLIYAQYHGFVPVSGDSRFHSLLSFIQNRVQEDIRAATAPTKEAAKSDLLAMEIMNQYLPDFELRSYDDVLEARERLKDELLAFRAYVSDLSGEITEEPYSEEFKKEVARKSDLTVGRAVQDIEKKVKGASNNFLISLAKSIVTASPVAFLTTLYPSIPSIVTWAVGAGLLTGLDVAQYTQQQKDINQISFLLKARQWGKVK